MKANESLRWDDAIDYAASKNMYIPSLKQAEQMSEVDFIFWTSTTDPDDTSKAFISTGESVSKISPFIKIAIDDKELRAWIVPEIVLVKKLETDQKISYRFGDIEIQTQ